MGAIFARRLTWHASEPPHTQRSSSVSVSDANGDTDLQMTVEAKDRIRSTWPLLSHDPYGIGARVFLRIFQLAPDVRKLFNFDGMSETELVDNGLFRIHASRFIRAIDLAVNNLDATLPYVVLSSFFRF